MMMTIKIADPCSVRTTSLALCEGWIESPGGPCDIEAVGLPIF